MSLQAYGTYFTNLHAKLTYQNYHMERYVGKDKKAYQTANFEANSARQLPPLWIIFWSALESIG